MRQHLLSLWPDIVTENRPGRFLRIASRKRFTICFGINRASSVEAHNLRSVKDQRNISLWTSWLWMIYASTWWTSVFLWVCSNDLTAKKHDLPPSHNIEVALHRPACISLCGPFLIVKPTHTNTHTHTHIDLLHNAGWHVALRCDLPQRDLPPVDLKKFFTFFTSCSADRCRSAWTITTSVVSDYIPTSRELCVPFGCMLTRHHSFPAHTDELSMDFVCRNLLRIQKLNHCSDLLLRPCL
jgi:hypothetical protein